MPRKKRNQNESKNVRLGVYFLFIVAFIVVVSFSFKVFDSINSSKFDRNNLFTVAIQNDKSTEIISISPKEGSIKKITVKGLKDEITLNNLAIPYDSLASAKTEINDDPRNYFIKSIFGGEINSDLSIYDVIKLSLATRAIGGDKVKEETVNLDGDGLGIYISSWFVDPEIENEEIEIEVTNATNVSGLGRAYADLVTNMGGNVVLVSSTQENEDKSMIYYTDESYTVEKLSNLLEIDKQKKDLNSVSDIIIQIGGDRLEEEEQ